MRNRRLVDRAEGEMIILRLQPREQIARNRRQLAREPAGTVGGKLKAQEIAEHGRHGGSSESDQCSYYVLRDDESRIVTARVRLRLIGRAEGRESVCPEV